MMPCMTSHLQWVPVGVGCCFNTWISDRFSSRLDSFQPSSAQWVSDTCWWLNDFQAEIDTLVPCIENSCLRSTERPMS